MYCVPASAYSLLLVCGDRVKAATGDCADAAGFEGSASNRRAGALLTGKRGEGAQEELDVRREAWYERACEWNAAEGEGGADMVGEEDVSMVCLRECRLCARCGGLVVRSH